MDKLKIGLFLILLAIGLQTKADEIPGDAKTRLKLDCKVVLDGPYKKATKVVIRDVTYKTPPATWDNNNSILTLTLANGTSLEGVMNESNGNDPQDYRDSDPSEYSGTGGWGMYGLTKSDGPQLALITRSSSSQVDHPHRSYGFSVAQVSEGGLKTISSGKLECDTKAN